MERISSSSSTGMISKSELWLWHTVSLLKNLNANKLRENFGLPNIILNKEQPEFVLFLENETLVQNRMALCRSHGELFLLAMKSSFFKSVLPGNTLLCSAYHLLNYSQKSPPRPTSAVPVVRHDFPRDHLQLWVILLHGWATALSIAAVKATPPNQSKSR